MRAFKGLGVAPALAVAIDGPSPSRFPGLSNRHFLKGGYDESSSSYPTNLQLLSCKVRHIGQSIAINLQGGQAMSILRGNRAKFGVIAMAIVLTLSIAGATLAVAKSFGGYTETPSVEGLHSARGVVYDWAETDGPNTVDNTVGIRDWMISGEWVLDCHTACTGAKPDQIDFDMALAMMRESVKAEGNSSHGHQFSNFSATSVTVAGDVLTILGTIDGSGPLGGPITITLKRHASTNPQHFTFSFDLPVYNPVTNIIRTEVSGVVVESKGR